MNISDLFSKLRKKKGEFKFRQFKSKKAGANDKLINYWRGKREGMEEAIHIIEEELNQPD